ncbi:MAG: Fe-S cluster assembly protein SufD [Bacteroidota bacterium]
MKSEVVNKNVTDWYTSHSESFESKLNGNDNPLLKKIRQNSLQQLSEKEFPTLKTEEWKYTNLSKILNEYFLHASTQDEVILKDEDIKEYGVEGFDHHLLVFINGKYSESMSDTKDLSNKVFIGNLSEGLKSENRIIANNLGKVIKDKTAFDYLNDSYLIDGSVICIPDGVVLEKPVCILNISGHHKELTFNTPRTLIYAGRNSQASIITKYVGIEGNEYFTNITTEVIVNENAVVNLYKLELENENSYHVERTEVHQKLNSVFSHYNFSFGGSLVRNDINSKMDDENIECNYYGLSIGKDDQHIDNHTFIDHAKPNCNSNELYKSILDDNSHGVFSGKILVDKDAQITNAYQSNKNILLSEDASIDTKPQLEIYADDVKCSHGATVGHLDETALFYILSRGIPEEKAKSMLITAFAEDVVSKVKIESLRDKLNHLIFDHLKREEV